MRGVPRNEGAVEPDVINLRESRHASPIRPSVVTTWTAESMPAEAVVCKNVFCIQRRPTNAGRLCEDQLIHARHSGDRRSRSRIEAERLQRPRYQQRGSADEPSSVETSLITDASGSGVPHLSTPTSSIPGGLSLGRRVPYGSPANGSRTSTIYDSTGATKAPPVFIPGAGGVQGAADRRHPEHDDLVRHSRVWPPQSSSLAARTAPSPLAGGPFHAESCRDSKIISACLRSTNSPSASMAATREQAPKLRPARLSKTQTMTKLMTDFVEDDAPKWGALAKYVRGSCRRRIRLLA